MTSLNWASRGYLKEELPFRIQARRTSIAMNLGLSWQGRFAKWRIMLKQAPTLFLAIPSSATVRPKAQGGFK